MSYQLIAIIIIVIWVLIFAYYFYLTRQQNQLQDKIKQLRERLDAEDA